ncbi:ACP phosphodiesterase [Accumulibacter sp.]|uniref:acyl carrier protein phosphodiesterase n=1 Tax=Accumulibacter sp. TaxID=2053492 RepID=UPI0028C41529|nr:ACP phosphodiesterase [Accumulibacter sp.]
MNYLAHALLAGADEDLRLGGLLGDFVKGPLVPAPRGLSAAVVHGLRLHRRIDSFADTHPAFVRSRLRISAERRRYSGIIIDMFYDHFLAVHWARFAQQPLESFAAGVYALLERRPLPERLAQILPRMRQENWLTSYRQPAAVGRALDQIAVHRLRRSSRLGGAGCELAVHYGEFERDFLEFFPAAMVFAESFRAVGQGAVREP